jgi:hypothetical protein
MNKFLKALTVLAATVALSSPAAAQLSGQVDLTYTPAGSGFSTKAALSYAAKLGSNLNLLVGGDYTLNLSPSVPSTINLFARVSSQVSSNLLIGGRLLYTLSDIGVSNTSALALRAYGIFNAVSTDNFYVDLTPKIDVGLIGGFYLDLNLDVDAGYDINDQFSVFFGAYTGVGFVPFAFYGLGTYVELDYYPTSALTVFAGTGFYLGSGFSWDGLYAGVRYDLSSMFAVKLQLSYSNAFVIKLTGLYNR